MRSRSQRRQEWHQDAEDSPSVPTTATVIGVGQTLRRARRGRYTLDELGRKAGVSTGLISQIERGQGNPSVVTLTKLAYALDLSIGSFFGGVSDGHGVVRLGARRKLVMPHRDMVYELLTPDLQGRLGMVRTTIAPLFRNEDQPFRHAGEEVVHVLGGFLVLHVGGATYELSAGDTATYDSGLPHWWQVPSTSEPAELIAAMSPPSF